MALIHPMTYFVWCLSHPLLLLWGRNLTSSVPIIYSYHIQLSIMCFSIYFWMCEVSIIYQTKKSCSSRKSYMKTPANHVIVVSSKGHKKPCRIQINCPKSILAPNSYKSQIWEEHVGWTQNKKPAELKQRHLLKNSPHSSRNIRSFWKACWKKKSNRN